MEFSEKERDGIIIIAIQGEMIGGPAATVLTEKLRDYMAEKKIKFLVDLAEISWMNSSGLGILMSAMTSVRHQGGNLKLLNVSEKILELLRITKLNRVFEVFESEDEAIASFA